MGQNLKNFAYTYLNQLVKDSLKLHEGLLYFVYRSPRLAGFVFQVYRRSGWSARSGKPDRSLAVAGGELACPLEPVADKNGGHALAVFLGLPVHWDLERPMQDFLGRHLAPFLAIGEYRRDPGIIISPLGLFDRRSCRSYH